VAPTTTRCGASWSVAVYTQQVMSREVTTPAVSRWERRRARTREVLVAAARALIAEKGVEGLRVDQITQRADVAQGSFYNHFESKEQVVEAVVEEAIEGLLEAITASSTNLPDPEEASIAPLRLIIRLTTEDRADATFLRAVFPYAVRELERGVAEGCFQIDDVGLAVTGVIGGMLAIMRRILDGEYPADSDSGYALWVLRSFGIDSTRAQEVSHRPLPTFNTTARLGASRIHTA